jgi:hypothetical protein
MFNLNSLLNTSDKWSLVISLLLPMLLVLCFNFTLTFFEFLHKNEERRASNNKNAASICLLLFFYIPVFYFILRLKG